MSAKEEYHAKVLLSLIDEVFSRPNPANFVDYLPHAKAVLLHSKKIPELVQQSMTFQSKLAEILYQSNGLAEAKRLTLNCIDYYEDPGKYIMELAECADRLALIEETIKNYDQC